MKVAIRDEGIQAERLGRLWLKSHGLNNHQQIDWIYKHNGRYTIVEVKSRQLYEPEPFWGTGLDVAQRDLRLQIYNDLGIDTILLVFEKGTDNVYYQRLSELEKGEKHVTKNDIIIYHIDSFIHETFTP